MKMSMFEALLKLASREDFDTIALWKALQHLVARYLGGCICDGRFHHITCSGAFMLSGMVPN